MMRGLLVITTLLWLPGAAAKPKAAKPPQHAPAPPKAATPPPPPEPAAAAPESAEVHCTDCHDGYVDRKFQHAAVDKDSCTTCHEPKAAHLSGEDPKAMVTQKPEVVCFNCHDHPEEGATVHAALTMDGSCIACHDPHGSNTVSTFLKKPVPTLCEDCHDVTPKDSASVHGAITSGESCMGCHKPHSTPQKKLLKAATPDLCLGCHNATLTSQAGGKAHVVPNIAQKVKELPVVHPPAADECGSCHRPHAGPFPRLLHQAYPRGGWARYTAEKDGTPDTYALCWSCHDKAMLNFDIPGGETRFRNDKKVGNSMQRENLHWFHVVDAAGRDSKALGRTCSACHDVHGATQEHVLHASWAMTPRFSLQVEFRALPDGGECTRSCHTTRSYHRVD